MIGTTLDLELPTLEDTYSVALGKIQAALSALADSIATRATPAGLNITTNMSLQGNALEDVAGLVLATGNAPTAAGTVFYADGELKVVTAAGTVAITSGGAVNVAGSGSIGGMAGTAAVTYDVGTGEYRFFSATGVYADLKADDLVLMAGTGSVRFAVDAAVTTARNFIIKGLPTSGVSLLCYNSGTSTVEDAAVETTAKTIASALTITGDLTLSSELKHASREQNLKLFGGYLQSGLLTTTSPGLLVFGQPGTGSVWQQQAVLRRGDRPTAVRLHLTKAAGHTFTVTLIRQSAVASASQAFTFAAASSGLQTCTITTPTALGADEEFVVELNNGGNFADSVRSLTVIWDRP